MNTDDVSRDLARAFPAAPRDLSRLHDRLAADSQRDGILDVAYRIVDSPAGPLLLAATEQGLVRVAYAREDHDAVLQALANMAIPPATPPLLSWPGIRRRSAPSAAPARPTLCRSWCLAIASSAPTAA